MILIAIGYFLLPLVTKEIVKVLAPGSFRTLSEQGNLHEYCNRINSMVNALTTSTLSLYLVMYGEWEGPDRYGF